MLLQVPPELASCPSLAWTSLGGNPACAEAPPPRSQIRTLPMDQLDLGRPLGDGASGDVFAAVLVRGARWATLSMLRMLVITLQMHPLP